MMEATFQHIYLTGPSLRREELRYCGEQLRGLGHVVWGNWLDWSATSDADAESQRATARRWAMEAWEQLHAADILVCLTDKPGVASSDGAHDVALGIALARFQRVIVVGHPVNLFHLMPTIEHYLDWTTALRALKVTA